MIRDTVTGLFAHLRERWAVEDPEERVEGSGEVYLDPAYNGRYTAERRLRALSKAQEEAGSDDAGRPDGGR